MEDSEVAFEISENKNTLERILDCKLKYFAYPNGEPGKDYGARHIEMVKSCGYQAAFSTRWGVNTAASDIWQLARFTPWDRSPSRFMIRLLQNYRSVISR